MLVRTIDTVKLFVTVQASMRFERFAPIVEDVEGKVIEPLLGSALYDALDDYLDAGLGDSPEYENLLKKLYGAIVYLVFDDGFDLLNTKNSESGFVRVGGENAKDLFVGQERRLREKFKTDGYNRLDKALAYLEANEASFPEWLGVVDKDVIVQRTAVFNKIYDIRASRTLFLKTISVQRTSQEKHLRSVLGDALFDALLSQLEGDSLSVDNEALLPYVQKPAVWWAVVEAGVPFQEAVLERSYSVAGSAQSYDNRDDFEAYDEKLLMHLLESAKENAELWTSRLVKFLTDNAETYGYVVSERVGKWDFDNDGLEKTVLL